MQNCTLLYSDDKVDNSCLCNTCLYDIRKPTVTRLLKHTDCLSSTIFFTRLTVWFVSLCEKNSETSRERCLYLDELSHMLQIPVTALRFHLLNSLSAFYSPQRYSILKNNFLFIGNIVLCNLSSAFVCLFSFISPENRNRNSLLLMRERGSKTDFGN